MSMWDELDDAIQDEARQLVEDALELAKIAQEYIEAVDILSPDQLAILETEIRLTRESITRRRNFLRELRALRKAHASPQAILDLTQRFENLRKESKGEE